MPYSGSVLSLRRLRPCRHRPLRPAAQPLTSQALPPRAYLGSELTLTAQRPPTKGNESCPGPPGSGPKCFHTPRPSPKPRPPLSPDTQDSAPSRVADDPLPRPVHAGQVLPPASLLSDHRFSRSGRLRPLTGPAPAPTDHALPGCGLTSSWKRLWRLRRLRSLLCFSSCCSSSEGGSK